MTAPPIFHLTRGQAPLFVSFPHSGTFIPPEIAGRIKGSGVPVISVASASALLAALERDTDPGHDVVLFETSGGFDGAIPRLAERYAGTPLLE